MVPDELPLETPMLELLEALLPELYMLELLEALLPEL